jgi:methylmalonyl-CoA/ethylmalonyl-CoA epimerase
MSDLKFWYHHGGVNVPELDAAIAWYRDVLGFEVERRFPIPQIPAEIAIIRNGDLCMELFEVPGAKPLPDERREPNQDLQTHGNKHVAFVIENVETFGEELKRRGADVVWIRRSPHGANIFIRDNAGNLIEFLEEPVPTGVPARL